MKQITFVIGIPSFVIALVTGWYLWSDARQEHIPGFGETSKLVGMALPEIEAQLSTESYAVVTAWSAIPQSWPWEIRMDWPGTDGDSETTIWSMNQDGDSWEPFYSFAHQDSHSRERQAVFIYERKRGRHGDSYTPIAILHLDEERVCTRASRGWCDHVRSHPPFAKPPESKWPYYETAGVSRTTPYR